MHVKHEIKLKLLQKPNIYWMTKCKHFIYEKTQQKHKSIPFYDFYNSIIRVLDEMRSFSRGAKQKEEISETGWRRRRAVVFRGRGEGYFGWYTPYKTAGGNVSSLNSAQTCRNLWKSRQHALRIHTVYHSLLYVEPTVIKQFLFHTDKTGIF